MTNLEMLLTIIISISVASTGVMVWYVRKLLNKFYLILERHIEVYEQVITFKEHLDDVNSKERYFGDETLTKLLSHAEELSSDLRNFPEMLSFSSSINEGENKIDNEQQS